MSPRGTAVFCAPMLSPSPTSLLVYAAFVLSKVDYSNRSLTKRTSLPSPLQTMITTGSAAGGETVQPTQMAKQKQPVARSPCAHSWPARDYAPNVRRLLFAVFDYKPQRKPDEALALGCENQTAPEDVQVDATAAEPKSELDPQPIAKCNAGTAKNRLSLSESVESRTTTVPTATYSTISSGSSTRGTIELSVVESVSLGGYFGTVWDCSLALGAFLASIGPRSVEGKRVVEVGAGCGVVSAVCASLGAREVVATDTGDLLPLLRLNMERLERRRRQGNRGSIEVRPSRFPRYPRYCRLREGSQVFNVLMFSIFFPHLSLVQCRTLYIPYRRYGTSLNAKDELENFTNKTLAVVMVTPHVHLRLLLTFVHDVTVTDY